MTTAHADIANYIKSSCAKIETALDALIPEKNVLQNSLFKAARYSLLGGGKRLRPLFALAVSDTLGGSQDTALMPACALEMIHVYSLIHDDLPSMDNDDFRRGKPSLHKVFPEGHAILTGDFLLTYAFEVLAQAPGLNAEQRMRLVHTLSQRAGAFGMIGGQVLDIESEGKEISLEVLQTIHRHKTGALLLASIECGAICANATENQMKHLQHFGNDIGLAFQIIDDILDVTDSEKKHGKKVASDITNNKSTYVTLLGIKRSQEMADQLFQSAMMHLDQLSMDTFLLKEIGRIIIKQTNDGK